MSDMKTWLRSQMTTKNKKAMPILSFPGIQLLNINVSELVSSAKNQTDCMKAVADKTDSLAAVSFMDLSVEAECFGSKIKYGNDDVPTVTGSIVSSYEEAANLKIPEVGDKRTGINIEAIRQAKKVIKDRPLFAGAIGPFSLAGRLSDVTEAMIYCYEEPEMMHLLLEKCSAFIEKYILAFKDAGADGVIMAEPLAGLLSPDFAEEFSHNYVRKIIKNVQDDNFLVIYHNCGNTVYKMIDKIILLNASAYHLGNALQMDEVLKSIPSDIIVLGNINPVMFRNEDPATVKKATTELLSKCGSYPNYIISSGCDIPPSSKWENIQAFFDAVREYYK